MACMQDISERMSLKSVMGYGPGERVVLRSGDEAVYGRDCAECEQHYGVFLTLVSRGAVVLPRSEQYDSLSAKMVQRLREVLEAGPVFLDPHNVTIVCMRPVGVSCSRVGVCLAGYPQVFDMFKVGVDSWTSEFGDEEWLELVGQLLAVIRLRLVAQTGADQLFQVMDWNSNFHPLRFDPSKQTTIRVKASAKKLATPETRTTSIQDLLSFLQSPDVTVLTVNQSNRPRKETGELAFYVDSIFLRVVDKSAISETIKALNLDIYTHKVRVGIVSFQCLCLSLPPKGEVNRESVYQALVASGHPAVGFFYGDSSQPVWAVAGHGTRGSLRPGKVCGVGELRVKFASKALAALAAQQQSAALALLEKAETEFTSLHPTLIMDEHRQLSFAQQIRIAELIQRGVFAVDNTLKFVFTVSEVNNLSKLVSLLVRRQGEDEVAGSVYRTRIDTIRCAKADKSGLSVNVAIDYLARLQLLRVLQVADIVKGKSEINSYRPMLAVDIPWVNSARSPTISEEHKRHVFASFSQSFDPAAQDVRPLSEPVLSQVFYGEEVIQHIGGFLTQASLLAYSSLERTLVVQHWNHRAVCMLGVFCHVAFATLKHENVEVPAYALKFTDSTAARIMAFVRTVRTSGLPEAERIDAVNWALTRPIVAAPVVKPAVSLRRSLPANAILSTLRGPESPGPATGSAVIVTPPSHCFSPKTEEGGQSQSTDEDARRLSSSSGSIPDKAPRLQVNMLGEAEVFQAPIYQSGMSPSVLQLTCIPAVELDTAALPVSQPAESRQPSLTVNAILGTPRGADSSGRSPSISPATVSAAILMSPTSPSSSETGEGGLGTDQDDRRRSSISTSVPDVIDKVPRLQVYSTSCSGVLRATLPEESGKIPVVLQLTCTPAVEGVTAALPVSQTSDSLHIPLVTNVVLKTQIQNENPGHSLIIRPATISAAILMSPQVSPSSRASLKTDEGGTRMDEEARRNRSSSSAPRVIYNAPALTGYSRVCQVTKTEHSCKSRAPLPLTEPGITCPQSVGTRSKKSKWQALVSWVKRAVACT